MLRTQNKRLCFVVITLVQFLSWQTLAAQDDGHGGHSGGGYIDLATLGMSGGSDHTGHSGLVGGENRDYFRSGACLQRLARFRGVRPLNDGRDWWLGLREWPHKQFSGMG